MKNNNSDKLFGFRGVINPSSLVQDLIDEWNQDGIFFSVKEGVFEVKFTNEKDEEMAQKLAKSHIAAWNFRNDTKLTVDFNHSWKPKDNSSFHIIGLKDSVKAIDRIIVNTTSFTVGARVVSKSDSASFLFNQPLVEKSIKDEILSKALNFYSEEVVDEKRPFIGIYKALEVLIDKLKANGEKKDGMKVLAELAGKSMKYVDDVMQTAQHQRHAKTAVKISLSEQECKSRAKTLIDAYADSIK